jgi:hypothetical protein
MMRLAEPIIIARWWKNRGGEAVRVTLPMDLLRGRSPMCSIYFSNNKNNGRPQNEPPR